MTNYGIKISKPNVDVRLANPEELVFSSKYKTLKVSSRGSGTLTDASRTATIPHGLGYTPVFLVHVDQNQTGSFALAPRADSNGNKVQAYADSTNLYIKADTNYLTQVYSMQVGSQDSAREIEGTGTFTDGWTIGRSSGGFYWYGACRFPGFSQSGSVYRADLKLYVASRDGTGEVKSTIWGIDEDNTGVFSSGTPATARTKTTASVNHNTTLSLGDYSSANVTTLVNEILGRGGWSSGNALGLMFWDNASTNGNAYYQIGSIINTNLTVIPSSNLANYKYTIFTNQIE